MWHQVRDSFAFSHRASRQQSVRAEFISLAGASHSTSSTSLHSERSVSGINLVGFSSKPDGMHQRSYSVSSADQWNEAVAIPGSCPNPCE